MKTCSILWLACLFPQLTAAQAGQPPPPEPGVGSDTPADSPGELGPPNGAPPPAPASPAPSATPQAPPAPSQAPPPDGAWGQSQPPPSGSPPPPGTGGPESLQPAGSEPPPPTVQPAPAGASGRMYAASGSDYRESDPERDNGGGFDMPPFSFRIDPLNWVIEGRLGLELEVGIWKFITLELVPVFVVSSRPPILDVTGQPDNVSQESNGLGPISGTSIGVGFWLRGTPLEGSVLRLIFTNYGYTYESEDDGQPLDKVSFTERRLYAMFGSHSNYGPFTIAGGFGLGVELNSQQRCFVSEEDYRVDSPHTSDCPDEDEQHIAWSADGPEVTEVYDLNGWLHPAYLMARISFGFVIDL